MTEIRVPKMGMSTVDVGILEVFVKPGDRVAPGDPLVEIEGDKAVTTIECETPGVVTEVLVSADDERVVGDVLLRIDEDTA